MAAIVAESLLEVKDFIIEVQKAENLKLQQKIEKLENRLSALESDLNKNIDLHKNIDKSKLGFGIDTNIYVAENLTT